MCISMFFFLRKSKPFWFLSFFCAPQQDISLFKSVEIRYVTLIIQSKIEEVGIIYIRMSRSKWMSPDCLDHLSHLLKIMLDIVQMWLKAGDYVCFQGHNRHYSKSFFGLACDNADGDPVQTCAKLSPSDSVLAHSSGNWWPKLIGMLFRIDGLSRAI